MSEPAIHVENLSKHYGPVRAVDRISFTVQPGEVVGFLGPNGAGKSTTLRILTTYLPPTTGIVRVAGFDVLNESMEVRERIGYLPETVPLYTEMRVTEYLHFRAKLKGVDRKIRPVRVDEAMTRCRVQGVARRLIGTLSRGFRQRVGLADAMLHDPPILLLDEPTSGLDPVQIEETLSTIRDLAETHTVLFSHHILPEVEKVCKRVIIINQGEIAWDGELSSFAEESPVLLIEVQGPRAEISELLGKQKGVEAVNVSGTEGKDWNLFQVTVEAQSDTRAEILKSLANKGWQVRRFERRRPSLEDLFMNVVFRGRARAS